MSLKTETLLTQFISEVECALAQGGSQGTLVAKRKEWEGSWSKSLGANFAPQKWDGRKSICGVELSSFISAGVLVLGAASFFYTRLSDELKGGEDKNSSSSELQSYRLVDLWGELIGTKAMLAEVLDAVVLYGVRSQEKARTAVFLGTAKELLLRAWSDMARLGLVANFAQLSEWCLTLLSNLEGAELNGAVFAHIRDISA